MSNAKRKAASFFVLSGGEFKYSGPDKKKAREVSAKLLQGGAEVEVIRGVRTKLDAGDLKAALPAGAF